MTTLILAGWLAATAAVPNHATILLYHHVADDTPWSTSISPTAFADQLMWLAENGFTVLPLEAVADSLVHGRDLPDRVVSLTFDDAWVSVYTEAFPRLRARGWPFTVFVCPGEVDRRAGPLMTWDQMRDIAAAGGTIANHGLDHEFLQRRRPDEDDAAWRSRTRRELLRAQERIREEIGTAPPLFAYPFGEYDADLRALVIEQGWLGFGQQSGPAGELADPAVMPRFPMAGPWASMESFPEKMLALPLPVLEATPRDPYLPLAQGPGADEALRPVLQLRLEPGPTGWRGVGAFADGRRAEVDWKDVEEPVLLIRTPVPLSPGRSRYNVTAPSDWRGRWYWYSHTWIVGKEHGS
jgi:peptidoglycan/xylan/chitin deacetylase (PgdA/CDA1 family)